MPLQDVIGTLQVCKLSSPSYIPESLKDLFPSTEKRLKATMMVKSILQIGYDCPESTDSYYRVTVTTRQLLSEKPQTFAVPRSPHWPNYITRFLEQRGKTKEEILGDGMLLVDVAVVGKDYNIVYVVPRDKNMLFPNTRPPEIRSVVGITTGNFNSTLFCKYLQKGRCHACGTSPVSGSKLQACSRCKKGWYCNRDCQAADWPQHKAVCKLLKETKDVAADLKERNMGSSSSMGAS